MVFPDKIVVPVKLNPPFEQEYSNVFVLVEDAPIYSSVHDTTGRFPPKASPSFCVPAHANLFLAVIKAPTADHAEPLYSSVHDT